ncbi:MAG: cobamide remodeling phosphodiesterase CbiR [bacterium]
MPSADGETPGAALGRGRPAPPLLKGSFPFRLAATSYILPAPILPNLEFLGPYLDEVQLVLFESAQEGNLPSPSEIREMNRVAQGARLRLSVHLPTDLFLGDPDRRVRRTGCDTIRRFYERTLPLEPTVYVLHLDPGGLDLRSPAGRGSWLGRLEESMQTLLAEGLDPSRVAVENLDYPFGWVLPLVDGCGMRPCLDVGHLLRYGHDLDAHLAALLSRAPLVHLHGVRERVDHCSLELISADHWERITGALLQYDGAVCIEVFSLEDLAGSMRRMEPWKSGVEA